MHNQGLLAIAFLQTSAFLVLLVLYLLLYRDLPARFFRLWIAGWTFFTLYGATHVLTLFGAAPRGRLLVMELSLGATAFFLASLLDYTGRARRTALVWPLALIVCLAVAWTDLQFGRPERAEWLALLCRAAVCLAAGFLLLRYARGRRDWAPRLLGLALCLNGLHILDQPLWAGQPFFLVRVALDGILEATLGVALAVIVLEVARARTEELNDKLRRLTLIAAASTQTFDVDEILGVVLRHLVESLGASHGLVRLLVGAGDARELVVRASVGFTPAFLERSARVSINEPWARRALDPSTTYLVYDSEHDPHVRRRMEAEGIAAMVLVRLPGKEASLGVLCVGSNAPRRFHAEEIHFLVNVANLLGLTIQNVSLFEQAAHAERQWMYTFDSIEDPILVHDPQFRILRANQALGQRLGGVPPDSLVGRLVAEVLQPRADSPAAGRRHGSWTNCPYCEEAAGNGEAPDPVLGVCFLVSTSEFTGPSGACLGTVHVLKDITDRKRAEERYRNLIENVQEGVFVTTPDGRFLDFNDAFMRMLGYESREELMQTRIGPGIYVNPEDRERLKKLLREHGSVTDFEFQMRRRDGEVLTALESSFATRDATGAVVAYQGFVLDITERKRAEQEVRRRNRELMVLNSISQSLNQSLPLDELLDRSLRQIVELFGVDMGTIYLLEEQTSVLRRVAAFGLRSEYAGHFPPTVFPADLLNHIRAVRATVVAGKSLPWPQTIRDFQQKEGVEVSNVVVLWSKERILGAMVVSCRSLREFSSAELNLLTSVGSQVAATIEKSLLLEETRQALDNLRRTQEQLLQSEKMAAVGQLISGVAHELNNPLTAILGYSQLLAANDHVDARGAEFVEKLRTQALRTHRIVHNLLSFARQQKPERLPARLNQIVENTLALREYDMRINNIVVHRELAPDLPITAADSHQLQQVFLNILNNAVDAILERSSGGEIWVHTAAEPEHLIVEFADSGPGVRDPQRVFDPFYTTKPVGKGTGLGLSICYGIVIEHGGAIRVRNSAEPGRGAIFTVALPLQPVAESHTELPDWPAGTPPAGRILLVDDEEAVLELEQEILRGRCRSVRAVRSGREAQQILDREPVDLVITDLKMPGDITGRELYNWICRRHPELSARVIFTMSDARAAEVGPLLEQSGCEFVQKPFEVERFLGVVRRVLNHAEAVLLKGPSRH